ncbi:MAG: hypothetical protein WCT77_06005 [Bacteroidota bacterium]|jgi:hypothetical protein
MTKKQWGNVWVGSRVTMMLDQKTYKGIVIRVNSNFSQVLVRWDEDNAEIWYGRLGIELLFEE